MGEWLRNLSLLALHARHNLARAAHVSSGGLAGARRARTRCGFGLRAALRTWLPRNGTARYWSLPAATPMRSSTQLWRRLHAYQVVTYTLVVWDMSFLDDILQSTFAITNWPRLVVTWLATWQLPKCCDAGNIVLANTLISMPQRCFWVVGSNP